MAFNIPNRTVCFSGADSRTLKTQNTSNMHRHIHAYSTPVMVRNSQQFKGKRNWYSEALKFTSVFLLSKSRRAEQRPL